MNDRTSPDPSGFESQFVDWLAERSAESAAGSGGIGPDKSSLLDDMGVVRAPGSKGRLANPACWMSSDMLLDGVHFDSATQSLGQIGRKAIACSLSDCAAMAVRPVAVTVSLALPKSGTLDQAKELMGGMRAMAVEFDTQIVGGDTTRWEHPLVIDVAIVAEPYEGIEPVLRSGAKVGDKLYVTGPLGGSRLGRHLTFMPRVREARMLADRYGGRLHAMLDISDGLSLDLYRLCKASGVGATLSSADLELVVSDAARKMSGTDGKSAIDHVLSDGEDFELLLSMSGDVVDPPVALYPIGHVVDGDAVMMAAQDGSVAPIVRAGYVH